MKTSFDLRSTIGNSSWPQRGLAALAALAVAAVVGITLLQVLRPGVQAVPVAPVAQVAKPDAPNPNVPISGTGSAYDGGAYGAARPTAQAQPTGLGIDPSAGVDLRELPAGLTDYVWRSP